MPIEAVYYNSARNDELEQKLSYYGEVKVSAGEDKRSFLMALSEAVGRSDIIIAIGSVSSLAATLAKGLGMPLTPIDWSTIGISGEEGAALPQGALPLLVDGSVYGMIIESGSQCIIAVDDDPTAIAHLTDTYILTYLAAVSKPDLEAATPAKVQEQPSDDSAEEYRHEHIQPVEHFVDEVEEDDDESPDLFAGIEDEDFLLIDDRKRGKGLIVALIIVASVIVLAAVGGYFGYAHWWVPKQYDDTAAAVKDKYSSGTLEIGSIPSEYSLRFGELFNANGDIIGWISADGISLDAPIVTAASKPAGYYGSHLFDGTANKYGTPHIKYAYDADANVNPNLVVYGNNFGDSRAFADVERLLDASVASNVKLHTDSVFYSEDSWRLFSVMVLDEGGAEFNYADNLNSVTPEKREEFARNALTLSKVSLGVTASDLSGIGYNDAFLTLVTPYSKEKGKVVVAMAIRIKPDSEVVIPSFDETSSDASSDASSDLSSDVSSDASSSDTATSR